MTEPKRISYCNMCPYLGLCSSVCYCPSFSCALYNLQISRPSSYNTKLHSCSPNTLNKGFPFTPFNHVIWYGNLLPKRQRFVKQTKQRETFLWLKKKVLYLLFARGAYSVAQMRQNLIGILNGDIQPFLQPSQALGQVLLYCSTTIFNFKFWNILLTPKGGLLLQT